MMASLTQGKDTSLAYLKVVIMLLNENTDDVNLKLGRPLRMDDLDCLSSESMLKIVVFLLRDMIGDKELTKISALGEFNKFEVGDVTYDCAVDQIYHAVKQIFPVDNDLFHYSVLLLPGKDAKRTRGVLSYIMSFVLMCDEFHEQFRACFEEIMQDNQDKAAIYGALEDLKDEISTLIQERELGKQKLPEVQKDLQSTEQVIRKQQSDLAKLSEEVGKYKIIYEINEDKIKQSLKRLEETTNEKKLLEDEIVLNPSEIQSENIANKRQLSAQSVKRNEIGNNLEVLRKKCSNFESLIGRANDTIENFKSVISGMNKTKNNIEVFTKTGNELTNMTRKVEQMRREIHDLEMRHSETSKSTELKTKMHDIEKQQAQHHTKEVYQRIRDAACLVQEIREFGIKLAESVDNMKDEIQFYKTNIEQCIKQIYATSLHKDREVENAQQYLDKVLGQFSAFPALDK